MWSAKKFEKKLSELEQRKLDRKVKVHTARLRARRAHYNEQKKAERQATRLAAAQIRKQKEEAWAQRRAEVLAKRQARIDKKNAPKKLPKEVAEYVRGFEDGKRFALEGLGGKK